MGCTLISKALDDDKSLNLTRSCEAESPKHPLGFVSSRMRAGADELSAMLLDSSRSFASLV